MSKPMSISGWIRRMAIAPTLCANLLSASFLLLGFEAALAQTPDGEVFPDQAPNREVSPANPYGSEAVQAYLTSCNAAAEGQPPPGNMTQQQFENLMKEMCSCTIWELQNRYTIQDFVQISRGLQNRDPAAGLVMEEVVAACLSS
ncbi:MAG: hypothetical protein AAGA67_05995 [Cyanobacteria bacterium P01_F01_bin.153]